MSKEETIERLRKDLAQVQAAKDAAYASGVALAGEGKTADAKDAMEFSLTLSEREASLQSTLDAATASALGVKTAFGDRRGLFLIRPQWMSSGGYGYTSQWSTPNSVEAMHHTLAMLAGINDTYHSSQPHDLGLTYRFLERPPQMMDLPGEDVSLISEQRRYDNDSNNNYAYPPIPTFITVLRNTSAEEKTVRGHLMGTATGSYGPLGVSTMTPDNDDNALVDRYTFKNVTNYNGNSRLQRQANIELPPNRSVIVMFYVGQYYKSRNNGFNGVLQMMLYNLDQLFADGVIVDNAVLNNLDPQKPWRFEADELKQIWNYDHEAAQAA